MDPLNVLHPYIFEEILKALTTKELMEFTKVSRKWYESITSSPILMKRIYLGIRGDWMNGGDLKDIVSCSNRNFQNILISDATEIYNDVYEKILSNSSNKWKAVEIHGLTLKTDDDFEKLVKTFETSIRKLVLFNLKINMLNESFKFDLSKLHHLKISYCDIQVISSIIKSAPNLSSLELFSTTEYNDEVIVALTRISTLKKLELRGKWFNTFFTNLNCTEIKFQLEELSISCIDYVMPKKVIRNFLNFLQNQCVMKKIYLSEWFGLEILMCILRMSQLQELSIFVDPFFRWNIQSLPTNNSIEILDVRTLDVSDDSFNLQILLSAVPNLKTIRLRSINKPLAQFISENLKKLSNISLVHSYVCDDVNLILPYVEFM